MKPKTQEGREPGRPAPAMSVEPAHEAGRNRAGISAAEDTSVVETPGGMSRWEEEGGAPEPAAPAVEPQPAEPAVDYKDRWLRAEAELQNYRRRIQRESEQVRRAAEEAVLLELIATVDDLERALASVREAGAPETWTQGLTLVVQRVLDYLERQGVVPVDPAGRVFDPGLHEAILEMDAPQGAAPGTVVQVVRKGYRRGERPLRAVRVVVARISPRGDA